MGHTRIRGEDSMLNNDVSIDLKALEHHTRRLIML